ncbi:MAG: sigma-54 dependent transcriptional regulator [Candidatus Marinimicrobia bacterium]|nr:sigma-54 dependent transcriptional regulator [bacterium]MCG2715880.1 sigma-54 dependent transcriptional regulator [Candidatus Neomarinimicrobiota bacterium]
MHKPRILVVDDEPYICEVLVEILQGEDYDIESAYSGNEAIVKFSEGLFDLVLLDIGMPVMGGLEVLKRLISLDPAVAVIMATAQHDIATVVEAVKMGAEDYVLKPFNDINLIKTSVQKALKIKAIKDENRYLKDQLKRTSKTHSIIGNSLQIQELIRMISKVAPLNTTVMIIGETGTGKELVAQAIHQYSNRSDKKFISINCGGLPETLLESTLFGYEKGAFTGAFKRTKGVYEEAEGGTLFLDEIGETSPALQVRLLRVLQEKMFQRVGGMENISSNVRIVSATNKDLLNEVKAGRFREDLLYRLNVIMLNIPPFKEHLDDLPLLVKYFIEKYAAFHDKNISGIEKDALNYMMNYNWPGNIRELENVVERAVALSESTTITEADLPGTIVSRSDNTSSKQQTKAFSIAKNDFEKTYLLNILKRHNWNIAKAAREAHIPRQNFYQKLKKYNISRQ